MFGSSWKGYHWLRNRGEHVRTTKLKNCPKSLSEIDACLICSWSVSGTSPPSSRAIVTVYYSGNAPNEAIVASWRCFRIRALVAARQDDSRTTHCKPQLGYDSNNKERLAASIAIVQGNLEVSEFGYLT